jgi:hypothetical protein
MPVTVYASLADLKAWRTTDKSDRDAQMHTALAAASRAIDRLCDRRFWIDDEPTPRIFNARNGVVVDADGGRLLVDDIGSVDGLLVEQGGGASWSDLTSGIETDPLNAVANGQAVTGLLYSPGWTVGSSTRVRVTAKWGWPAVPEDIKQACLLIASALLSRRDSPHGVAGITDFGSMRVGKEIDRHAEQLVLPYRRVPVG